MHLFLSPPPESLDAYSFKGATTATLIEAIETIIIYNKKKRWSIY